MIYPEAPALVAGDYSTRIIEHGTKVNISIGDTVMPATLNDGKTAKALLVRLPFTMKPRKYAHDYCGVMENPLPYDEQDVHYGWLNGDIDFARDGNYFTILYEDEGKSNKYGQQINIGKIDGPLSVIKNMPEDIELRMELAKWIFSHTHDDIFWTISASMTTQKTAWKIVKVSGVIPNSPRGYKPFDRKEVIGFFEKSL